MSIHVIIASNDLSDEADEMIYDQRGLAGASSQRETVSNGRAAGARRREEESYSNCLSLDGLLLKSSFHSSFNQLINFYQSPLRISSLPPASARSDLDFLHIWPPHTSAPVGGQRDSSAENAAEDRKRKQPRDRSLEITTHVTRTERRNKFEWERCVCVLSVN